ncbi:MAG: hypothetical protein IT164_07120 [Bryobacterales bacterium]|nr:hypothetical protein [Bryobacterales bacterium]
MQALLAHPNVVAAVVALSALLLAAAVWGHRRLRTAHVRQQIDWKTVQSFNGEYYRPLERILGEDDQRFLERLPGYQPEIGGEFRKQRREIASRYLDRLEREFRQLHLLARTLVRDLEHDRPELAVALVRSGAEFRWNLWKVRLRLTLAALPLPVSALRPVSPRGLVEAAVWTQAQIRVLHAQAAASA